MTREGAWGENPLRLAAFCLFAPQVDWPPLECAINNSYGLYWPLV